MGRSYQRVVHLEWIMPCSIQMAANEGLKYVVM